MTDRPRAEQDGGRLVVLAAITGAHGIAGQVKVKLFTEDLSRFAVVNVGGRAMRLAAFRRAGAAAVIRLDGVSDRTAAEALRGQTLTVDRAALPPLDAGEYYHADLLGLAVVSDSGETLGRVVAVDNYGAADVIEIERPTGKRFMVPMTADAVPEWNAQRLVVATMFAAE